MSCLEVHIYWLQVLQIVIQITKNGVRFDALRILQNNIMKVPLKICMFDSSFFVSCEGNTQYCGIATISNISYLRGWK